MGASTYDTLVDTEQVTVIGKTAGEIGDELKALMLQVTDTVMEIMEDGMKGQVQLSLDTAYSTIEQSQYDQMDAITAVGGAVVQVANNTAEMDADVASKLTAEGGH